MKNSFHWFHKFLLVVYILAIVWTSIGHATETRATAGSVASATAPLKIIFTTHGPMHVRAYVQRAAHAAGVDPRIAEWIVSHESRHHPEVTGDGGESRGLWQINKVWHPEVSDGCAYDVICSTDWSLQRIRTGYLDEWSTWKYCKTRFEDCPFQKP